MDQITYKVPEHTDDGWQTANLKEVGINEKILGMASVFFLKSGSKNPRKKTYQFQDSLWLNGVIDMAITGG